MTEEQTKVDWREEIKDAPATLKILDGETKKLVFMNNGEKKNHPDFGTSVVFEIEHDEQKKNFYVKETNYDLLKQIRSLGDLMGIVAEVSRTGDKKSDTRYTIKKVE